MKYIHKSTVVDAYQWPGYIDEHEEEQIIRLFRDQPRRLVAACALCKNKLAHHGQLIGIEEKKMVCPGDYIVTSIYGGIYPIKADVFKQLYEEVAEKYEGNYALISSEVVEENAQLLQKLGGNENGEETKS